MARKTVIGVVHLPPLPGSPRFDGDLKAVFRRAQTDAQALLSGGVDGIILENFGDAPFYPDRVPPITVALMAVILKTLRGLSETALFGVNVLRNDAEAALAVAAAAGAHFIRVNIWTGAMVTDQGILQGPAWKVARQRSIWAPHIRIFADVLVKHAMPLGEQDVAQVARDTAYRGLADALIVTGPATGEHPDLERVQAVREAVPDRPLYVGSGVTPDNLRTFLPLADGFIVGSAFKEGGRAENPVDPGRVRRFMETLERLTQQNT